jgi:hypothetical protein
VLILLMLLSFVAQVVWLILVTWKMKENAELRRLYPEDRKLKNIRAFLIGLFFWGLFLGCWYVVYLARNVP